MREPRKSILWLLAGLVVGLLALGRLGERAMAGESGPPLAQMAPAFQMGSAHYGLNWNVSANGGGTISSAHFIVSSTIGQPAVGMGGSTHFDLCSGYWCWSGKADITVSPSALAFGNQGVYAGSTPSQMVTISNDGDADLQISSVGLTGTNPGQFAIVSDSGESKLPPGPTRTVRTIGISFDPSSAGDKTARLRIVSNDSDEATLYVVLSGTGVEFLQEITVSPSSLNFGSQDLVAGPTPPKTVTISNDGNADLQISSVGLTGTNPGQFAIQSDSGEGDLAPSTKRTIRVVFNPSSTGAKTARLTIVSNDADEATVNVALSGTGTSQGNGNNDIYLPLVFKNH